MKKIRQALVLIAKDTIIIQRQNLMTPWENGNRPAIHFFYHMTWILLFFNTFFRLRRLVIIALETLCKNQLLSFELLMIFVNYMIDKL